MAASTTMHRAESHVDTRLGFAYVAVLLFMFVYFARPGDWVPGMAAVPLGKITGVLALVAFALGALQKGSGLFRLPIEIVFLILLFGQLCLAVPLSIWAGGSFNVVSEFLKVVLITIVIAMTATSLTRFRRLLFLQSASVILMAAMVALRHKPASGGLVRTSGVLGGVFENPNELALSVTLVFPFCLAFLLQSQSFLKKAAWAFGMAILGYVVIITYSRSGFVSLLMAVVVCLWEFGFKGRRPQLILLVAVTGLLLVLLGGPAGYGQRIKSIFNPELDYDGSYGAREEMLRHSLKVTLENPLVGVGPGNFELVSGIWRGTHNAYTQLSSEAGIPALILFVLILRRSFLNVRRSQQLAGQQGELQLSAGALRASLAALVVGLFFGHVAYQFYPYFLVAYSGALYQIAQTNGRRDSKLSASVHDDHRPSRTNDTSTKQPRVGFDASVNQSGLE